MHSKEFSGNKGKHQILDPSILPYKFGPIFMGMNRKKKSLKKNYKMAVFQNENGHFSKSPILKIFCENCTDWSLGKYIGLN